MLLIHPFVQAGTTLLALYVFYLGLNRFMSLHLSRRTTFKWRSHVLLGEIVILVWLGGLAGGLYTVKSYWRAYLITGDHARVGLAMLPFLAFGLLSGLYLNRVKRKRKVLPFLHGLNNLTLIVLALVQAWLGVGVYQSFVLGN